MTSKSDRSNDTRQSISSSDFRMQALLDECASLRKQCEEVTEQKQTIELHSTSLQDEVTTLRRTVQELEDWNGADFRAGSSETDSSALQSTVDSLTSRNRQLESDLQRLQLQQRNNQLALERLDEYEETIGQLQDQLDQERSTKKKSQASSDGDVQRLLLEERKRCEELSQLLEVARRESEERLSQVEHNFKDAFAREKAVLEEQIENERNQRLVLQKFKNDQIEEHENRAKELNLREIFERQLIGLNEEVQSLENDKIDLNNRLEDLRQQLQSRDTQLQTFQSTAATPGSPPMLASSRQSQNDSPSSQVPDNQQQLASIYDQFVALLPGEFSLSDTPHSSLADRFVNLFEPLSAYLGTFSIIQEELDSLKQILIEKQDEVEKLRAHLQEQQSLPKKTHFDDSDEEELEEILDFHQRAPSRQSLASVTPGEKQQLIAQNELLSSLLTEKEQELVFLQQTEKTRGETFESVRLSLQRLETDMEGKQSELNDIRNVLDEKLRENSSLKKEKMYFIEKLAELERERQTIVQITPKQTSSEREKSPALVTSNVEGMSTHEQYDKLRANYDELLALSQRQHEESLSYYNEYNRIVTLYNELNDKHSQLQVDYESVQTLIQQKNEAYLQCQNELNTFQNLLYHQKKKSDDVESLTSTLNERGSEVHQLRAHETELLSKQATLESRVKCLEEDNARLQSKQHVFDQIQVDLKRSTHERDLAIVEKKQLENAMVAAREKLARLEESERTLTKEVDRLHQLNRTQAEATVSDERSQQELMNELGSLREMNTNLHEQLQSIQEQSQQEREQYTNDQLLQYQDSLRQQIAVSARLTNENNEMRERLDDCNDALSSVHRLNEELQTKELLIAKLQSDIHSKSQQVADYHENVQATNSTRVEKQLVKSILLSYFHTPIDKQQEVVPILSALVGFTQDEYDKAMNAIASNYNNSTGSSWLSGWLGGNPVGARVPSDMPEYHPDKSFAELLIQYVDHQSPSTVSPDECNSKSSSTSTSADKPSNGEHARNALNQSPSISVDKVSTI